MHSSNQFAHLQIKHQLFPTFKPFLESLEGYYNRRVFKIANILALSINVNISPKEETVGNVKTAYVNLNFLARRRIVKHGYLDYEYYKISNKLSIATNAKSTVKCKIEKPWFDANLIPHLEIYELQFNSFNGPRIGLFDTQ